MFPSPTGRKWAAFASATERSLLGLSLCLCCVTSLRNGVAEQGAPGAKIFFKEAHSVLLCFTMRAFKSRQPEHWTLICAARKSLCLRGFTCTAPDHKQLPSCERGLRMVREWGKFFLISLFSCGNLTGLLPSGRHWCKTLLPFSAESRQRKSRLL